MYYCKEIIKSKDSIAENNLSVKSIAENVPYYVYFHYLDGEVFYIGKGSGLRCLEFKGRSKAWVDFVDGREDEVCVFINRAFSCESEAFNYESKAIMTCESKSLVNVTHNDPIVRKKVKDKRTVEIVHFKRPTNVFLSNSLINNVDKIKDIKMLEFNILVGLISQIREEEGVVYSSLSYNDVRVLIGSLNLQAHKIKKILYTLEEKYGLLSYEESSKSYFYVQFSDDFKKLFLSDDLGYSVFNFNEFISIKSIYSKILYLKLSEKRMTGDFSIKKKDLINLFEIPNSYDEYNFITKALLPAVEDNSNYFVNLKLSNLRGNMLPEVCKFNFFKKRGTKMEREIALATRENIFDLIEEYR